MKQYRQSGLFILIFPGLWNHLSWHKLRRGQAWYRLEKI